MLLGLALIVAGLATAGFMLGFFGTSVSLPLSERAGFVVALVGGCIALLGVGLLIHGMTT